MKKITFLFATVIVLVLFVFSSSALEPTGKCGEDVYWSFNEDTGKLVISGEGNMYDYDTNKTLVPWIDFLSDITTVNIQENIVNVGDYAFWNASKLKSVTLSNSITSIGDYGFYNCQSLENINLSNSITQIGDYAFSSCSLLKEVDISGLKDIPNGLFSRCTNLTEAKVNDSLLKIGSHAFAFSSIETFDFPNTVTEIGMYAFRDVKLKEVILPPKLKYVQTCSFGECTELVYVYIPSSVYQIKEIAFYDNPNLMCVEIEEGNLMKICGSAFSGDAKLTYINIPNSVETIEFDAFYNTISRKPVSESLFFAVDTNAVAISYAINIGINYKKICSTHSIENNRVEPTCTANGKIDFNCSNCRETYGSYTLPKTHNWSETYIVYEEPSCQNVGYKSIQCITCEALKEDSIIEIPKKEHIVITDTAIPATCTTAGLSEGSHCCVCKIVIVNQTIIPKNPHNEIKVPGKVATCSKNGLTDGKKCSVCGTITVEQKTVSKKLHYYKKTTTKATVSRNGKDEIKCSVCGYVKSATTIYYPKTIKLSATTFTYNGKNQTPSVTVKDSKGKTLKKGTDYTVTYPKKRKSIGKYTVTVTFKGNYSGTKKLTYEIVPAKVNLAKVTAGSKQLTANWKTVRGVTGYEVVYSISKKFTKKTTKTVTIKKAKTKKTTIVKLKKGKKYYVKVRAYKTVGKNKIYGAWSAVKNVKVK